MTAPPAAVAAVALLAVKKEGAWLQALLRIQRWRGLGARPQPGCLQEHFAGCVDLACMRRRFPFGLGCVLFPAGRSGYVNGDAPVVAGMP